MAKPLADRLRPKSLDDIVGQKHLLGEGKALRNLLESGEDLPNLIFYGPSGTGKTTLASIIAARTNRLLIHLNGTSASTADIRDAVSRLDTLEATSGILLYLDEIQYFNKKQQQSLLEYIETGAITLIASTTENPYFYVYNAILSRSTVFEFKSVPQSEIQRAVERALMLFSQERGESLAIEEGVCEHIAAVAGGDVRKALNLCEMAVLTAPPCKVGEPRRLGLNAIRQLGGFTAAKYDRFGDEHYDLLSAYQKSMRGSDANAAVHYLARILEAGDLPSAIRRLLVCANEDVGLAYPMIIPIVKAACDTALQVGLPEARIPLANAVVLVCNSPKSNSAYNAINQAVEDVKMGRSGPIPRQLQNMHFDSAELTAAQRGQHYKYPHSYKNSWVKQQYLPDEIKDRVYYVPGDNKTEQAAAAYWEKIRGGER